MRGVYTVTMNSVTLATTPTAQTLVSVHVGTNCSLKFRRAWCSQSGTATSQQLTVELVSQVTAFPTLTAATPQLTARIDQASKITSGTAGAAGTSGINASAEGAGAKTVLYPDTFNNLNGWIWIPTPGEEFVFSAGDASTFSLFLATAPSSGASWTAGITFEEV